MENLNNFDHLSILKFVDNNLRDGDDLRIAPVVNLPRTDQYFNFYTQHILRLWNNIPVDVKCLELSESGNNGPFKKALKKYFEDLFNNHFDT